MSTPIDRPAKTFDGVHHGLTALVCAGLAVVIVALHLRDQAAWWVLPVALLMAMTAADSAHSLYHLLRGRFDEFYTHTDADSDADSDTEAGETR